MAHFVHTALPDPKTHIRLLEFNTIPSSPDSLSLSPWSLKSLPEYTAISYTWGPVETVAISVNGQRLQVRTNCHAVLRQAAAHCRTTHIWIDSICIDQEGDIAEKNAQVSMMYKIYRKAAEVLVCVGEHAHGSDRLLATISATAPLLRTIANNGSMWRARPLWTSLFAEFGEFEVRALLEMLQAFDSRPYFRRLWIIQELYAGRNNLRLVCGHHAIPHGLLRCFLAAFNYGNPRFRLDENDELFYLTTTSMQLSVRPNMKSIFKRFGPKHLCFDPRDRLFGLQSFLDKTTSDIPLMTVDYSRSKLDLAMELMPHYDSDGHRAMLGAFELTARSTEMEQLVTQSTKDSRGPPQTMQMTLRDHDGGTCRIYANDRGELQADFGRYAHGTGVLSDQAEQRERVESAFSSSQLYFRDVPSDRVPKQVWCGSNVAALVDARAQTGDLIVAFAGGFEAELNSLLILRSTPQDPNHFVVVGQGIAAFGYDMSALGTRTCSCELTDVRRHTRYIADYELDLPAEEVMAYTGQDFVGPEYYHWAYDIEKRLERLLRCPIPVLTASRTVRMRVTRCFAHRDTASVQSSGDEAGQDQQSNEPLSDDGMTEASDAEFSIYDSMVSSSDDSTSSEDDASLSLTEKYRAWQIKKFGPRRRLQDLRADYERIQAKRRQDALETTSVE